MVSAAQKERWVRPLLAGAISSAFLMTELDVASSDATNIETSIERDGADDVINGRKWWSSGVGDPCCKIAIVMGRPSPAALPSRTNLPARCRRWADSICPPRTSRPWRPTSGSLGTKWL
jgi:alkylation response protein AidB-like acyl-CoA dehydrogenase